MTTIDIIGLLYSDIAAPVQLPGWHVNTIPAVPEWAGCKVEPSHKRRVFAGMAAETCCYVFESEADFVESADALGLIEHE